ncbi:MAG TPA: response regulator [Methanomicrobiales archaeon]|nr:response regulator [Methanomicrobiales archaeon]
MSKVLVVDDEAIITMQLEERLTALGYEVVGMAASGEESIEKARRLSPDIILMDIVMPGKMNGIEAAKQIYEEMGIPVVFVTSYADDAIIEKAKAARPYGYIVKPFNELEIKAAIEVGLFRSATEPRPRRARGPVREGPPEAEGEGAEGESRYLDLPGIKTILLRDIFTDLILFLYTDQAATEAAFKFAIEEGLKKGGRNLFAYQKATVQRYFLPEIQREALVTKRVKKGELYTLLQLLQKCTAPHPLSGEVDTLRVLLDFNDTAEFEDMLAIRDLLLGKKAGGMPISGVIALNIGQLDHTQIRSFSEGLPRIIVSTGKDTMLSFAHRALPADSLTVVPQATLEEVVKKSLEPVVLSLLSRPVSGYDLVREIHNRYRVLIPQARIYTLLYELEEAGHLEVKASGKSKLYVPTEKGRKHIRQKLSEFRFVFQHILDGGMGEEPAKPGKGRELT